MEAGTITGAAAPAPPKKKKRLQWARHQQRWWGKWHLYLGIFAGLIVSVVGVTGSILVFQDEIDRALNRELFDVLAQQKKIPLAEIVPIVKEKYPGLSFLYAYEADTSATAAYRLLNFSTEEEIFINPYTGEQSGRRIHESSFIHVVTEIHRSLLIPVAGRYIVGFATLILLILTITGLRLWIPQKWKLLKSVLTVNFRNSLKRQNYDWHNVVGFYSSPVVALLSLTGVCFTFSIIVVPLLFLLSGQSPQGVAQVLGAKSVYSDTARQLPLSSVIAISREKMPDARVAGIALPADSTGSFRLDMLGPGLPVTGKREMLLIDQYTGKVLLNSRTDFPNVGNAYLSWLAPIHYGSFGGRPTQVIALVAGITPLVLFITGFIIWWPRYQKQRRNDRKKAARAASDQPLPAVPRKTGSAPATAQLSTGRYFWVHTKKGIVYAGWFVLLAAVMGALFGLASGIIVQPAVFSIIFTAILVVANFIVALVSILFNMIFLWPLKRASRPVVKYFALSLSFTLVFVLAYCLLINTGLKIF